MQTRRLLRRGRQQNKRQSLLRPRKREKPIRKLWRRENRPNSRLKLQQILDQVDGFSAHIVREVDRLLLHFKVDVSKCPAEERSLADEHLV